MKTLVDKRTDELTLYTKNTLIGNMGLDTSTKVKRNKICQLCIELIFELVSTVLC